MKVNRAMSEELKGAAQSYPVVTMIGPRQSGKTTIAKMTFPDKPYASLEDPDVRSFAKEDPRAFLQQFHEGAILDEIQRVPELLSYIQCIVDEHDKPGLFILTGSHQLALQESVSQSLAGRTAILHLFPLSLAELPSELNLDQQIYTGFYPRIYKHKIKPSRFYSDYVQTYVERDVKLLLNIKDLEQFQRFLKLCAARIGQLLDYTQLANDLGCSRHTVKEWVSILQASFLLIALPPYFENLGKRVIKSPKLYFADVGLACYLLDIHDESQLAVHPLRGYLFENMVLNEVLKSRAALGENTNLYFYRDSNQLEVDILFKRAGKLYAVEVKSSQTFHMEYLKGLKKFVAIADQIEVEPILIYSGQHEQEVHGIQVMNYKNISKLFTHHE